MKEVCIFIVFLITSFKTINSYNINSYKILSSEFIDEINGQQKSWTAGRNFHVDSELKNLISISFKRKHELESKEINLVKNTPPNFDARSNWPNCSYIGSVQTQGNCASSYALVPASMFTDRLCVQKNILRRSSADQLLTCCKKCGAGCFGGHMDKSFMYMNTVGLVTGGGYNSHFGCRPYRIDRCSNSNNQQLCPVIRNKTPSCYHMKCYNKNYKDFGYDKDKLKITSVYSVPASVDSIKSEIITNGPVSAMLTVNEDFFNYKKGVYYRTSGFEVGQHDVKIIGWGETKKKQPFWLVVNTWGSKWGDKGLFKIRLGVNECNIEAHVLSGSFLP